MVFSNGPPVPIDPKSRFFPDALQDPKLSRLNWDFSPIGFWRIAEIQKPPKYPTFPHSRISRAFDFTKYRQGTRTILGLHSGVKKALFGNQWNDTRDALNPMGEEN